MPLHLNILPPAQLKLWLQLKNVPKNFVLYGGTAIALQLGHRVSVDFDFFSQDPLDKNALLQAFPLLTEHKLVQPDINTIDSFRAYQLALRKFRHSQATANSCQCDGYLMQTEMSFFFGGRIATLR